MAASSADATATEADEAVQVDENGCGRVVFRQSLLRKFGTVWEAREVNASPVSGMRFSYYNNSKNAHNSNILQVILRDHGFNKTEPPDDEWNVFWCAGQARGGTQAAFPAATARAAPAWHRPGACSPLTPGLRRTPLHTAL